jgi:hypothetical protein
MLLTKPVMPVERLVATVLKVPEPFPEVGTGVAAPLKSAGIVAEKIAGKVSRRAPQKSHLKKLPSAS